MHEKKTKADVIASVSGFQAGGFAAPGTPMLADALAVWDCQDIDPKIKKRVRQDALNLCKRLGLKPEMVIAHHAYLNPQIRRLGDISRKRLANIKHSLKSILRPFLQGRSFKCELTPEWAKAVLLVPDAYTRASVRCMTHTVRLRKFCRKTSTTTPATGCSQCS